jgi:5-methyltetrahydrofolate--homocysteine methyltransferase
MAILDDISAAVQAGKKKDVEALVQQAIDEGVSAQDILNGGLLAAMDIIGPKFKNNEIFVPEVLVAARAMNAGTTVLKPLLASAGTEPLGKAVIGTVKGDMHDIGKNLVKLMLESKGFEVVDLKVDVPPDKFVDAINEHQPDIVCISALLTTTMGGMRDAIKAIDDAGLRSKVKILVGGAPITQAFSDDIGADGYAVDAASAAELAVKLLKAA